VLAKAGAALPDFVRSCQKAVLLSAPRRAASVKLV
jgi:hypothetical protein